MTDLILKKRAGLELSENEIRYFVQGYVEGVIPDYQMAALLMAICFMGMNIHETTFLTLAMAYSGDVVDLSAIAGNKVDKHSTGGVGDTTTLITVPLVAACGVPVAKMSGRGLGHTGGTIDKLESIPGFNAYLSKSDFIGNVNRIGLSVIGQTENLVPADKKLYSLRDVTGTVDSIPLIASSVMSKKIASGADAIVLDVKSGDGAFMKSLEEALALAREMVEIGKLAKKKTIAIVTDMDQPLGSAIGNALEVKEAVRVLKGEEKGEIREVSLLLAAYMIFAANMCNDVEKAYILAENALNLGMGADKLKAMIYAQGGNGQIVDNPDSLHIAPVKTEVVARSDGFIEKILAQRAGQAAMMLGAGRTKKDDAIDHSVGIIVRKKVGSFVKSGDAIATMYSQNDNDANDARKILEDSFVFNDSRITPKPVIQAVVMD